MLIVLHHKLSHFFSSFEKTPMLVEPQLLLHTGKHALNTAEFWCLAAPKEYNHSFERVHQLVYELRAVRFKVVHLDN